MHSFWTSLFSRLSIKARLLLLAVGSVAVALLITCMSLLTYNVYSVRNYTVEQLQLQARMLAFNSSAVLTFQDASAAEQLLTSLSTFPSVESAYLADSEGTVLATFPAGQHEQFQAVQGLKPFEFTSDGWLLIRQPVTDREERVGALVLRANLNDYYIRVRDYALIMGSVMAVSFVLASLLAFAMQRTVSSPIAKLVDAARTVAKQGDYSVRVRWRAHNELGQLCATFDQMLEEIQGSKDELQAAHDQLECRVEERTAQLTAEIQERKRVLADLEKAKDQAEAASKAKTEFLANMSHEIRTPLNGVLGYTDLLKKQIERDDRELCRDSLEIIQSSGKHLLVLINDVLDISKIESGQFEVERIPCCPHEVITQVTSVLRAQAQQKGLELQYRWATCIPATIQSDPARLRQLLMNLVGNAIKFTEQGFVCITARLDEAGEQLAVSVEDTGVGILPEKQKTIFDPFVQADTSVTRQFGGTGLGLAISRRLARKMGGDLTVASEEGQGSCFTARVATGALDGVHLYSSVNTDALMPKQETSADRCEITLSGTRILVVEDGSTNRKLVKAILEEAGALVSLAENGQVGLELGRAQSYNAILMDMQMPVMDGYTAARKLREAGATVPIIGLTAHAMSGDRERCLSAGCCGYLTKPIDADELLRYLASRLRADQTPVPGAVLDTVSTVGDEDQDPVFLRSSLPTDKPVYAEIVCEFADYATTLVQEIEESLASEDFTRVAQIAHSVKGAGGSAGFAAFTDPARELERAAKDECQDECAGLLEQIRELSERILIPDADSQQVDD